jgi:hypothetical protein
MNHFFYEFRGNEKARELVEEGLNNQALRRAGALKSRLFGGGARLALALLAALGFLVAWLAH